MSTGNKSRLIGWIIFAAYLIILFKLTVFRHDFMAYRFFSHGTLNLIPFSVYVRILRHHRYLYFIYLFGGNVAWFIPFGYLLPYLTGRPKKLTVMLLYGFLLSFVIEFSQYAFGTGESELDDLILNTLGTALGFLLYGIYDRLRRNKNKPESKKLR